MNSKYKNPVIKNSIHLNSIIKVINDFGNWLVK